MLHRMARIGIGRTKVCGGTYSGGQSRRDDVESSARVRVALVRQEMQQLGSQRGEEVWCDGIIL